jgi:hypothetical protein
MGSVIKAEFLKEGENRYCGQIANSEIDYEGLKNKNILFLNFNPSKRAFDLDIQRTRENLEKLFPQAKEEAPRSMKGLKINFILILTSPTKMILSIGILLFNKRVNLTKEGEN